MEGNFIKLLITIFSAILGICLGFLIDSSLIYFDKYITLNHFDYVLKLLFIFSFIIYLIGFIKIRHATFSVSFFNKPSFFILITAIFLVMGFNAAMRSTHENSWFTIGGIMPFSDAGAYYKETIDWPKETLSMLNSWRPLNSVINFFFFFLGAKTPLGFFLVRIFFLALVIGYFWFQVRQMIGMQLSIIAWLLLVFWVSPFLPTWLTEINGLIFSLAGINSLLEIKNFEDNKPIFLGLFLISISNTLRPFNYFLPILFSCIFLFNTKTPWFKRIVKTFMYGSICLLTMLLIPKLTFNFIGHKNSTVNGNTGSVLLGIARNTNWDEATNYITNKYPSFNYIDLNRKMKEEAIETFKKHPNQSFIYLINSLKDAYITLVQKLFQIIININLSNNFNLLISIVGLGIMMFLILSLYKINLILALVCLIGIMSYLSFAPIVFNDGRWRITATLLTSFSLILPLSFFGIKNLLLNNKNHQQKLQTNLISNSSNLKIPIFVVLIFVASMLYTFVTWKEGPNNLRNNSITLILDSNIKANKWTGFESISTNQTAVVKWLEYITYSCKFSKFEPLKDYFLENKDMIKGIVYNNDNYLIIPHKNCVLPPLPNKEEIHKWAPMFKIKYQ